MSHRITRRDFIKTTALGSLAIGAAGLSGCAKPSEDRKPNLLFIWTDQQRFDTLAAYGNRRIKTPNLSRLANQSLVFDRAYCAQPVCTPSRSSLLTGLWPHTNGCTANNILLRPETPCFPELLNDPDYRTAYMGKWHLGDEVFPQHGFEEWVSIEDQYAKLYSEGRDRSIMSSYNAWLQEQGHKPDEENGAFSRLFPTTLSIKHSKPAFLREQAIDFLTRNRRNPFVLHVSFLEPHPPFAGPLDRSHDPRGFPTPANFHDEFDENDPMRYRLVQEKMARNVFPSEKAQRELNAIYYGLIEMVDHAIGAILAKVDRLGLAKNTIVVFTSDHGEMMGAHRIQGKEMMFEESARVPFLIRYPAVFRKPGRIEQTVSHIDMVPTLLEMMGKPPREDLPGQSLLPLTRGEELKEDHVYMEWNPRIRRPNCLRRTKLATKEERERVNKESTRAIVTPDGHWKLCLSDVDKNQLYNLKDDPFETTNLYYSGEHKDVIAYLAWKIHDWQEKTKDIVKV